MESALRVRGVIEMVRVSRVRVELSSNSKNVVLDLASSAEGPHGIGSTVLSPEKALLLADVLKATAREALGQLRPPRRRVRGLERKKKMRHGAIDP